MPTGIYPRKPTLERFQEKITVKDDCWLWNGFIDPDGHGQFWWNGRDRPAHRFAWLEISKRPLAKNKLLHHTCSNRHCVNPDHLTPITRANHASLHGQARTHCKRKHPLSGENVIPLKGNRRGCRECRREAVRKWRRERAAAG